MQHQNSSGLLIHHTPEGIQNFHRWFENSKTIDHAGRPLVLYHGTTSDVSEFSKVGGGNQWGRGFYFHPSPKIASDYAMGTTTGQHSRIAPDGNAAPNVISAYVSMKNPFVMDDPLTKETIRSVEKHIGESLSDYTWPGMKNRDLHQQLHQNFTSGMEAANRVIRGAGFDGLVERTSGIHMAFEPEQIKSATGNNGEFSMSKQINEQSNNNTPENDRIAEIWKRTATQPWHIYAAGMALGGQENDTPENKESRERVKAYLDKHGKLFGI